MREFVKQRGQRLVPMPRPPAAEAMAAMQRGAAIEALGMRGNMRRPVPAPVAKMAAGCGFHRMGQQRALRRLAQCPADGSDSLVRAALRRQTYRTAHKSPCPVMRPLMREMGRPIPPLNIALRAAIWL